MEAWFSVTEYDIKNGTPRSVWSCPVAKALSRILKDNLKCQTWSQIYIDGEDIEYTINSPGVLFQYMVDFDEGKEVKPARFSLEIPEEYLKLPMEEPY